MLKFDEQKQIDSVNGALALRGEIESIIDKIVADGYKNICWLGIGGTWASSLQAEVHMKEFSAIDFFVENAAEYNMTGNKRIGEGTIVIISSVSGTTVEVVESVKKVHEAGAKVFGFIDKLGTPLAEMVDYIITYPANEQLKFFMVADYFMKLNGEFPQYDDVYAQFDAHLAKVLVEVEKAADAFGKAYAEEQGIPCWISMEEKMACGIGACLACTCQSKEIDHHSHVHNKRVCKDGPVFLASEVEL